MPPAIKYVSFLNKDFKIYMCCCLHNAQAAKSFTRPLGSKFVSPNAMGKGLKPGFFLQAFADLAPVLGMMDVQQRLALKAMCSPHGVPANRIPAPLANYPNGLTIGVPLTEHIRFESTWHCEIVQVGLLAGKSPPPPLPQCNLSTLSSGEFSCSSFMLSHL